MDELSVRRALANLTDDSEVWQALDHVIEDGRINATQVAIDVDVTGEGRVWQCGYAAALTDLQRTLNRYRHENANAKN